MPKFFTSLGLLDNLDEHYEILDSFAKFYEILLLHFGSRLWQEN
mgnify:CR=1 FL=1